ncbi:MAG: YbaB/EbfC family nucleoid-associated protein [Alphaproteobacteria bacterium]|nr:YbaB/EbfC family nucleoid-associated protein [Alphaproteobacteria bacterium]
MKMLSQLLQQAQAAQGKIAAAQERLASEEVEGHAGGGLVTIAMNGKGEANRVHIDPSLLKPDEADRLEALVLAALRDARGKQEALMSAAMKDATGGLPLPPGLKLF